MKTIAIDLDDTLNNFTETLQKTPFPHDPTDGMSEETFQHFLKKMRQGEGDTSELLSNDYASFCGKIISLCHEQALPRPDGIEFMQWLKTNQWRIVICTFSDLRSDGDRIRQWLNNHQIPYDYLFMAVNKLDFCKARAIDFLVDDHLLNVQYGSRYGIQVFYPIMTKHKTVETNGARGFTSFNELKRWIQN